MDEREILVNGKIDSSILESHRKMMYEFALKNKRVVMSGGCACASSTLTKEKSDRVFGINDIFSYVRAMKLLDLDFNDFEEKKRLLNLVYSKLDTTVNIVQDPIVLIHFYTGSNLPNNRTVQRYFSMLGHKISTVEIKTLPYCYNDKDLSVWNLGADGSTAFVDTIDNLNKYRSQDFVALSLLLNPVIQFIFFGTKNDILKEMNSHFCKSAPSMYGHLLARTITNAST
jgi:hypothetical protein